MSVVVKKNGLIYCVYQVDGKRTWEPFGRGPAAKRDAQLRDMEIQRRLILEEKGFRPTSSLTFFDLAQLYMAARQRELADHTRDGILRCLSTYALPAIGNVYINRVTMDHWRQIQSLMVAKNIKNRTINTYFKYISHVFTWAIDENDGILERHPWEKRKPLQEEKFQVDLFTLKDLRRIMDNAEEHLSWILELAYLTGARPGPKELFSLTWDRVDYARNRIRIRSAKNYGADPYRWQYLPPDFMEKLKTRQHSDAQTYPQCRHICHYKGKPIKSIKKSWAAAKKKAGITRRIRPYDIRHYHITYALAMGADIKELAERVGHATPRMIINVYAHLAKEILQNEAHRLPKLHENDTPKQGEIEAILW